MSVPRVLLVDDDEDLLLLCQMCLEANHSFQVVCSTSGEKALELAAKEPIDIVLVDLCMPGMDGETLRKRLRAAPRSASVPVVLMTAAGDAPIQQPEEWSAILHKPFDVRRLAHELQRVLDRIALDEEVS